MNDIEDHDLTAIEGGTQQTCWWSFIPWVSTVDDGDLCIGLRW